MGFNKTFFIKEFDIVPTQTLKQNVNPINIDAIQCIQSIVKATKIFVCHEIIPRKIVKQNLIDLIPST